ncbi:MAG: terminase large subunit domain-containing protein [Bryobacteraceae bacterium]
MIWHSFYSGLPHLFAQEFLGFRPRPVQSQFLRHRRRQSLLNCSRQWGKSTVAASLIVHRLVFGRPGGVTLVIAPSHRQSAELLAKAAAFLCRLDITPRGDGRNEHSLLMPNGSRVVALPGVADTTRGFSADLLVVEEAALVPDDTYLAMRPSLAATQGAIVALSTPAGPRGFFYEAWTAGGAEWDRWRVPATDCPHFPPGFLDRERRAMGEFWFRQEYLCEFTQSETGFFPRRLLEDILISMERQ